jgi:hypothetical protein
MPIAMTGGAVLRWASDIVGTRVEYMARITPEAASMQR